MAGPASRATGICFSRTSVLPIQPLPSLFLSSPHQQPNVPYSPPQSTFLFLPLLNTMGDTIETAQHFIYVQVFFNASLRALLTPFSAPRFIFVVSQASPHIFINQTVERPDFPLGMCKSLFTAYMNVDLASHSRPIDAVVLWDWIISLPREWRFVCRFLPPTCNPPTVPSDLEDHLDSGQSCIPLLSVRENCRTTYFDDKFYIFNKVLGHRSRTISFVCLRHKSHPRGLRENLQGEQPLSSQCYALPSPLCTDPSRFSNVEPSRIRMSVFLSPHHSIFDQRKYL